MIKYDIQIYNFFARIRENYSLKGERIMKIKKIFSVVLAFAIMSSLASCGGSETAKVTATLSSEDANTVADVATALDDLTLENKTIRWFSFYDINPSPDDETIPADYVMFTEKFGGKIEYTQVVWGERFTALANQILGGNSPDFYPANVDTFPSGAMSGMCMPVNDYIDLDDDLWVDLKEANEMYSIGDNRYAIVINLSPAGYLCVYSRDTMEEYGFDDPAELFYEGKWTWDVFKDMCVTFTNPEEEKYAIDGWFFEAALMQTAGVPLTELKDGQFVCNIDDPRFEKTANFMYDLAKNGVVYPRWSYGWVVLNMSGISSGQTLFWPVGTNDTGGFDPSFENTMIVPMPKDPDSDRYYINAGVVDINDGVHICAGAPNPEGVAVYMSCKRLASMSDEVKQINIKQAKQKGWTDEQLEMIESLKQIALENNVIDFSEGISGEYYDLMDPVKRASMGEPPSTWAEIKATYGDAMKEILKQVNADLGALS